MEGSTIWMLVGGGLLIGLLFLFVVWKMFFSFLKHAVIILILGGTFVTFYWYRTHSTPTKKPAIGKHAYLTETGKYLGVVEGEGDDSRRGPVWNIRFPGGHPRMYGKSRVTLKDNRDIASEPTPEPTETPSPSPTAKPGADKKTTGKK
ncbi:MAG TPA: hypothetical protein PLD20_24870 [Blastocatellia bacterium]|nr:hypothetical protein [Blastocatellia bacterium]HMV81559.1 hypothetical protein [Blastocatellia bacterium]HMX26447.1 hypothetical protein [Blastocatellia bacterium]HMY75305.1 hypothetical protein [Blastocatellia bacterium]HMZ21191.1 hypothetical protein [Blastocatellia bacterium]